MVHVKRGTELKEYVLQNKVGKITLQSWKNVNLWYFQNQTCCLNFCKYWLNTNKNSCWCHFSTLTMIFPTLARLGFFKTNQSFVIRPFKQATSNFQDLCLTRCRFRYFIFFSRVQKITARVWKSQKIQKSTQLLNRSTKMADSFMVIVGFYKVFCVLNSNSWKSSSLCICRVNPPTLVQFSSPLMTETMEYCSCILNAQSVKDLLPRWLSKHNLYVTKGNLDIELSALQSYNIRQQKIEIKYLQCTWS